MLTKSSPLTKSTSSFKIRLKKLKHELTCVTDGKVRIKFK